LGLKISPREQVRALANGGIADKLPLDVMRRMADGMAADYDILPEIARVIGVDCAIGSER
jgi:hypothetical protein